MLRLCTVLGLALLILGPSATVFCQVIPGCHPVPYQTPKPCAQSRPAPTIARTVQVDVPVPCARVACFPVNHYAPISCSPPVCSQPPSTRPVQVRVEIRVRPEPCGPKPQDTRLCADPLRPVFGLVAATMAVPIRILEGMLPLPHRCAPLMPVCGNVFPPLCAAPAPICGPAMPAPAYRKCAPRSAHTASIHRQSRRPVAGPTAPTGYTRLMPIQRPIADPEDAPLTGTMAGASSFKGGVVR